MKIIQQYNPFACVGARIESFFSDNGRAFSHRDFISKNLDLFNGGTKIEGSISSDFLTEFGKRAGFSISPVFGGFTLTDKEAILLYIHWRGDEGNKHFVRFVDKKEEAVLVMNPNRPNELDAIPEKWIRGVFRVTLV